jgi:hypothetical protein
VGGTVVVVAFVVVVVPTPKLVVGDTTSATAGRAVVLRITPSTSEPIEPISTERRGPRREAEERPLGSPERFCPCVILVMDQLSKTKSKRLPTHNQLLVNSNENVRIHGKSQWRILIRRARGIAYARRIEMFSSFLGCTTRCSDLNRCRSRSDRHDECTQCALRAKQCHRSQWVVVFRRLRDNDAR